MVHNPFKTLKTIIFNICFFFLILWQNFLLSSHTSQVATEFAEKSKQTLIDEFFTEGRQGVPEIEGPLYLKAEGKKSWKKYFFILRASGLYYTPKGKSKVGLRKMF